MTKPKRNAATVREVAAQIGVDRGTLQKWFSRGCPRTGPDGLDVKAILRWRASNIGEWNAAPGRIAPELTRRWKRAQAREREARAALAELKVKIERGDLVPLSEVKEWDLARIHFLKRGLWELPRIFADLLVGMDRAQIAAVASKRIKDLFDRFRRM